ncbi:FAD-dependent oxidoreductase [Ideonella alba]|uniref:FAD-dependent oxidoreductase n=1 Tax=Ideonella alba TaxID=2824118 RepID=A0A940YAZ1_9BURK|nr:FAD-dependent oxidoreductase [Ideonella alba]MBQ0930878.1 FAD-dependent oxidoreductase [Ideonella alba]
MHVAVIGAGLAGVCSAFELAAAGHQVTVVDRHAGVAAEGSFANGGLLAGAYTAAWQAPGLPTRPLAPVQAGGWGWQGLRPSVWSPWWRQRQHRRSPHMAASRSAMLALSRLSRARLDELTLRLGLAREHADGLLVLLRSERELAQMRAGLDWLGEQGVVHHCVDADGARAIEPGLSTEPGLHAALHFPGDAAANSRQFVHQLKTEAQALGVRWLFQHQLTGLSSGLGGGPLQLSLAESRDPVPAGRTGETVSSLSVDAVVLCAAQGAPALLQSLGVRLPAVVHSACSFTAPLRLEDGLLDPTPRAAILDQRQQISIARQGDRVRVAGSIRPGVQLGRPHPADMRRLYRALDDWFPGAAHTSRSLEWCGPRLAVADGLPVIGPSGVPGVWLNTAHGASGWTLACGAALQLASQIGQQAAPVDPAPFAMERLR